MAIINSYPTVTPAGGDLIIGTDVSTTPNSTKTFTVSSINALAPQGTVTSVALTETGTALAITGSPITSSGTINIAGAGTSSQVILGDLSLATLPVDGVTSVALTMPAAFSVAGSPITSSGTIAITGAGSASQVILGNGTLGSLPGGPFLPLAGGTMVGNTLHNNNVKSRYGTTPTLEIYSNSTTSFIAETSAATGSNLTIQGNTGISLSGGGASLFSGGGGNDTEISDTNGVTRIALTTSNVVFPSGSVGIGTTSPGAQLEINNPGGSSVANFRLQGGLGGQIQFRNNSFPVGLISTNATGTMQFSTGTGSSSGTSSKITILSSGNVGVGTNAPASKLEVDGGDIEVDDSASGLILRAPNGTRYRVKVDNSGNLTTTAV